MKRILPFVLIVFATAFTSSCSKSYTCTCVVSTHGVSHAISKDLGQVSKGDADTRCSEMQQQYIDSANSVSSDCHL